MTSRNASVSVAAGAARGAVGGDRLRRSWSLEHPFRNVGHGKHVVHQTRGNRIPRHVSVFRLVRILGDGESPMFLHTLQSARPVRSRA